MDDKHGVIIQDLKGLFNKHGEREVLEAVFRNLLEPALDKFAGDLPDEFRLIGASGATVAKAYLEKALQKLESKLDRADTTQTVPQVETREVPDETA